MSNLYYLIKLLQLFPAYFIYTPLVTLSMFVALSNFRRHINLLSSSHPSLSIPFFTLSTNLINVPAQHITHTTLSPALSCARSLRQYIFLTHQAPLAIVPFWLWGIGPWLGVFSKHNHHLYVTLSWTMFHLSFVELQVLCGIVVFLGVLMIG